MSMSISCSPPQDGDHHRRRPPALDLLDEYWFFSNTLANNSSSSKPPRLPSNSNRSAKDPERSRFCALGGRRLLRTPSLPPPRSPVGMMEMPKGNDDDLLVEHQEEDEAAAGNGRGSGSGSQQQQGEGVEVEVEVDDDDLNWSSIYEGVLRTRMAQGGGASGRSSALRRAPSMPVASSSTDHQTKSRGGRQVRSLSASQKQQQQPVLERSMSVFPDKWRSSSDLESIEVQGFRDLGFVFDKEELRESLAGVLPGLKQAASGKSSSSSRPYLSEAWQQRPPALVRVQSDARSAAEMKDQLRMWAQAVACNMRQDC